MQEWVNCLKMYSFISTVVCAYPEVLPHSMLSDVMINQNVKPNETAIMNHTSMPNQTTEANDTSVTIITPLAFQTLRNYQMGRTTVTSLMEQSLWLDEDRIIYTCVHGYHLVSGNLYRICEADGQWSGQAPVCEGQGKVIHYVYILEQNTT